MQRAIWPLTCFYKIQLINWLIKQQRERERERERVTRGRRVPPPHCCELVRPLHVFTIIRSLVGGSRRNASPPARRGVYVYGTRVCAFVRAFYADLPGGVRNREGCERAAAGAVATGAVGGRRALLGLAVLRDDWQRLLERVRRQSDDRRAALLGRRRSPLHVRLLTTQPARERRGKCRRCWELGRHGCWILIPSVDLAAQFTGTVVFSQSSSRKRYSSSSVRWTPVFLLSWPTTTSTHSYHSTTGATCLPLYCCVSKTTPRFYFFK